jgi:NADPH2:quinone reductase
MLAWTLVKEAYPVQKGDYILVHAAAGGVGLLLCQMASYLGAHVIGTTSTPEKAKLAKENGAEYIIDYSKESIVDKVLELTGGNGVQGIYDGVGKDTWEGEL